MLLKLLVMIVPTSNSLPWSKVDELKQRSANYAGDRGRSERLDTEWAVMPTVAVKKGMEIKLLPGANTFCLRMTVIRYLVSEVTGSCFSAL